ncbi:hypothetical protein HPB47_024461 [Ixodes persulcatus]|uniref:Uncharacterized protein n=1 Tax=Ixodes persulcatus TaxID=34615 RepID=A0AC60Q714_IXOPE|nr:hypothetical protein HPB47_024461 [Ixodes persulcatus]
MDRILDNIRSSVGCVEPHLLNVRKKDLPNIAVEFNIVHPERLDSSDAVNIDPMVWKMCGVPDSPIICYKSQSMGSELGDKGFMLGIMTPQQQLLLAELGTDKIQIDSTHGINGYDFQLTTLDKDKFHKLMEGFLDKLKKQEEPALKDFHDYLVT